MKTFITYKNTQIHYTVSGKGTAIVLLHGFLENSTMWNSTVEEFSKRNRVVCIDLLGHGLTENLGYVHTMEQMADAVHAVLVHLKIRKYVLVGHSMGGYVSLALAEEFPDNVKGICLLNSTSRADSPEKQINRDRAIAVVKENHKSFIRNSIPMLFRSKNRKLYRAEIAEVKEEALQTSKQGIIAALEGMKIRQDREVLLHFGPYPKMMVLGEKDPVLALDDLLSQVENTETVLVRLSEGHMSHIENKPEMLLALKDFVKNCS
ncbi:alpha/beta fold hydrolase [Flavicella sediminum]|uniref:alpha/beta fold hydrolase n=1 Tax=Flavicella sediminum TaxID=2585141 RepID=UPI00111D7801|nr:alpha/beta hydrolase [Flavicella sediminum]